jgi:hypothetical protein
MFHEDLILENGRLTLQNGKRMLDELGSVSVNLVEEIRKGTVTLLDEMGELSNDIGEVKDLVLEGTRLVLTTVEAEGEQTRELVGFEFDGLRVEIRQMEVRISDQLTQVQTNLSIQMGEVQGVLLRELDNIDTRLKRLDQRTANLTARFGEGGDNFDSNADGGLDLFELMDLLGETGGAGQLAVDIWGRAKDLFQFEESPSSTPTEVRGRSKIQPSRQDEFVEFAVNEIRKLNTVFTSLDTSSGTTTADNLLATLRGTTGWDRNGDGDIAAVEILDILANQTLNGLLDADGAALWDVYKENADNLFTDASDKLNDGLVAMENFATSAERALQTPVAEWALSKVSKEVSAAVKEVPALVATLVPVAQDMGRAVASCGATATVFVAANPLGLATLPECVKSLWGIAGKIANLDVAKVVDSVTTVGKGVVSVGVKVANVIGSFASGVVDLFGRRRHLLEESSLPAELEEPLQWAADVDAVLVAFENSFLVGLVEAAAERDVVLPSDVKLAGANADVRIKVSFSFEILIDGVTV